MKTKPSGKKKASDDREIAKTEIIENELIPILRKACQIRKLPPPRNAGDAEFFRALGERLMPA